MAKILLVDDVASIRIALKAVLMASGHDVEEAENGRIAIQKLASGLNVDLIITDILMPEQDGTEVILHAEKMHHATPILAMSGGGTQLPADLALLVARSKAQSVLMKPFENTDFMCEVDRLLDRAA